MNQETDQTLANGAAAAAVLAAGIGSLALGSLATLAAASPMVAGRLVRSMPGGSLAGKSNLMIATWLVAWMILHALWKDREVNFDRIFAITLVLIGIGLLLTFPPVFGAFE